VGSPRRFNSFGDMAGNAHEWCPTPRTASAYLVRPRTAASTSSASWHRPPFDRDKATATLHQGHRQARAGRVRSSSRRDIPRLRAFPGFSDAVWQTWLSFLSYPQTPLEARTELENGAPPYWRLEKVTFAAAYGGERMLAYLFLPKSVPPPYQTVVFWPGAVVVVMASSENGQNLPYGSYFDYLVKDGRAVLYPVLKGSLERGGIPGGNVIEVARRIFQSNDLLAMQIKDVSRSIDYPQSRPDMAGD
jgi:hypothetical protein